MSGLNGWLSTLGYAAVALFVGVEGIGIPIPGETMLIAAAIFAAEGHLSIAGVIAAAAAGAIVGNCIGFGIGWFGGYPLLRRFGKYVRLNEPQVKVGRYIFARHGTKVVFFGRFVSILRTYLAFLAGANRMPVLRFLAAITAGGIVWAAFYGIAAYALGNQITHLERTGRHRVHRPRGRGCAGRDHLHQVPGQAARGAGRRGVPGPARGLRGKARTGTPGTGGSGGLVRRLESRVGHRAAG